MRVIRTCSLSRKAVAMGFPRAVNSRKYGNTLSVLGLIGLFFLRTVLSSTTPTYFTTLSPSPPRTPVRGVAAKLKAPVRTLRFDNDSSDGEVEEPSPASATSYRTVSYAPMMLRPLSFSKLNTLKSIRDLGDRTKRLKREYCISK